MFGCVSVARSWRSRVNSARLSAWGRPRRNFTAARCRKWPSSRSARNTLPMPPCPISRSMRQMPRVSPGAGGRFTALASAVPMEIDMRVLPAPASHNANTSEITSASAVSSRSLPARSSGGSSETASKQLLTLAKYSGVTRQSPVEPGTRETQIPVDGRYGDAEQAGDLVAGETREAGQMHDLAAAAVELFELGESFLDGEQIDDPAFFALLGLRQGDADQASSPLAGGPRAGMIDQDRTDRQRHRGKEMHPVLEIPGCGHRPQQGLVHQLGGGQGHKTTALIEAFGRDGPQLFVDLVDERAESRAAPLPPGLQQDRERIARRFRSHEREFWMGAAGPGQLRASPPPPGHR